MEYAEDLKVFGQFLKTHGIDGRLVMKIDNVAADHPEENEPVFVEIDGIPVPFFIKQFRCLSDDTALVQLDEVDSSQKASMLVDCRVFLHKDKVGQEEESFDYKDLEGFRIRDEQHGGSGILIKVVDYSDNVIMVVEWNGKEVLIPLHEDIVRNIDYENRIIDVSVPGGLFDLYL